MKKLILLTLFLFVASMAYMQAQTNKGRVLMGISAKKNLGFYDITSSSPDIMSIGFSTMKSKSDSGDESDKDKITNFNLSPKVGYFVIKNLAIGLDLNVGYLKYKEDGSNSYTEKITQFTAGPFVRYYIPAGKAYPFIEANAAFGFVKWAWDSSSDDDVEKTNITSFGGGAGVAVPIGKRVTFDTMLCYTSMTVKNKENNDDNYRTIIGTFGIKFAFLVSLGKQAE
jgi:hypothetical protein